MNTEGFDFEIHVEPSAIVRFLRAATLALGAAGLAMSVWLAQGQENAWLLFAFGLAMLWVGWRHGRLGLARGCLSVTGHGSASWHDGQAGTGASQASPAPVHVRVERWFAGERLAWLRLRDSAGRRYEVLVGRDSIDEDRWRRLSAWLTWLRRGVTA